MAVGKVCLLVLAFFCPPVAVCLATGGDCCSSRVLIAILLSLLAVIPGMVYAFWVVIKETEEEAWSDRDQESVPDYQSTANQ